MLIASSIALTWSPDVMINTKTISDVHISPDHQSVLFVASEPQMSAEKGFSLSKIYKGSTSNSNASVLVADESSCVQPRWSPDGMWVAFLSHQNGINNLSVVGAKGGNVVHLTEGTKSVQTFAWSPDGKKIAFVMADETEIEKKRDKTSLAYVYGQHSTVNRLWLIDAFAKNPTLQPLTSDEYCVLGAGDFGTTNVEFDWSADGQSIVFAFSPNSSYDSCYIDSSLAIVHLVAKIIVPLEKKARYEAMPRFSPDGNSIAYLRDDSPKNYAVNRRLAIRPVQGTQEKILAPTPNEGCHLAGPNFLGWTADGKHLLFFEPHHTSYHLVLLPIDGKAAQEVNIGTTFLKDPALSPDKKMVGFVGQASDTPPEAYVAKLADFKPQQVSSLNQELKSYPKTRTEVVSWQSQDKKTIEGLLTYPVDYDSHKKYPLLVMIHGGPMGFFEQTFVGTPSIYPLAAFAQEGFMILRPNPRGSTGYGKEFRSANYADWGGMDYHDIMTGVDSLIAQGLVDSSRLGVMGWSYGGYMTSWIIGQTSRFKAASSGAGLCNLISMNGTTDLNRFLPDCLGADPALYQERSPLTHVGNITTPCLIQHGDSDKRVPISQAYELYHALKRADHHPTLIIYPGMGHRLHDPKMQLDAMKQNLTWFLQYVK